MRPTLLAALAGAAASLAVLASPAAAEPTPLVYEGTLSYLDAPVNSRADLRFRLFDAATEGAQIGQTIELPATALADGAFRVTLDFAAQHAGAWLEVGLRAPAGEGEYVTLSPRQRVDPAEGAIAGGRIHHAGDSETADTDGASLSISPRPRDNTTTVRGGGAADPGASATGGLGPFTPDDQIGFGPAGVWVSSGANVVYQTGNVGIGTGSPSMPLTLETSTAVHGILATNSKDLGRAVTGLATGAGGNNFGVFGISFSPTGTGVFGQANDATGVNFGLTGTSQSTNGTGVRGLATATTGSPIGVRGQNSGDVGYAGYFLGGEGAYVRSNTGTNADSGDLRAIADAAVIIEGVDAMLELISDNTGVVGSVITLKELMTDGTYVDHWAIGRDTGGANSSLVFTYENTPGGAQGSNLILETNGNVGVGREPTTNNLEVAGAASKAAAGSWLANSDARIKSNIQTVTHALDTIDRVRLVSFEYTDDYLVTHTKLENRRYLNVIAQEFAEVFPEHVQGSGEFLPDGSEILQVDTYPLTIYAAAAVQELGAVVNELETENDEQSARIAALESRIESLAQRPGLKSGAFAWPLLIAAGLGAGLIATRRGKEAMS